MGKSNVKFPMTGIEIWRNEKNKFCVFQAHYTADPLKRAPGAMDALQSAMTSKQFRQEYEIVWESFIGQAVYPDFAKEFHGSKFPLHAQVGLPLLLGVDQGLHPAAVVCQLQEEQMIILKEYTADNMGAERFCQLVKDQLRVDFRAWGRFKKDFLLGMDPTGFNRRDVDERTYASVWAKDFVPQPGANLWEPRRASVERWLVKARKGQACLRVDIAGCPILVEGFEGGYRYPDRSAEIEPTKIRPVKDKYSQPHDALQYILTLLENQYKVKPKPIPGPGYAFGDKK